MLETDCPYLTPESKKGRENQPAFMIETAERISELKNLSIEDVIKQTTNNATQFFGLN